MCCWDCGGNSGCAAAVGNVGGWRSASIGWTGSVISGIAVSTSSWKPAVSSWMGCPVGDQDNGLEGGAPVWISIRWVAGSAKKWSGCWKRRTTGRSPGKTLAVAARSPRVPCVQPGARLRRSHAGAVAEPQRRFRRPHLRRQWLRNSMQQTRASGRRTTAFGCSAGRAQPSRQPVRSLTLLQIRLAPAEHCRAPAVAGPTNGWRGMGVG